MGKVKLDRHPGAEGRVGIPADGEWFETEDAERLVGQGIATRTPPEPKARKKSRPTPAKEG